MMASEMRMVMTAAMVEGSSIWSKESTKYISMAVLVQRASASLKRIEICISESVWGISTEVLKSLTTSGCVVSVWCVSRKCQPRRQRMRAKLLENGAAPRTSKMLMQEMRMALKTEPFLPEKYCSEK